MVAFITQWKLLAACTFFPNDEDLMSEDENDLKVKGNREHVTLLFFICILLTFLHALEY